MNITPQPADKCRVRVFADATAEESAAIYKKILAQFTANAAIPGFRRGHLPRETLLRHFGDRITAEWRQEISTAAISAALKEESLAEASFVGAENFSGSPETEFKLVLLFDVAPELKLPKYKDAGITAGDITATDAEIDTRIDELRKQFARADVVEGPAQDGDYVEINGKWQTWPAEGEPTQIRRPIPADDETLLKYSGSKEMSELREKIQKMLTEEKRAEDDNRIVTELRAFLAKKLGDFDLPQEELEEAIAQAKNSAAKNDAENADEKAAADAAESLRFSYAAAAIAKNEGITVEDKDLDEEFSDIAARLNYSRPRSRSGKPTGTAWTPAAVRQRITGNGALPKVKRDILVRKAITAFLKNVRGE